MPFYKLLTPALLYFLFLSPAHAVQFTSFTGLGDLPGSKYIHCSLNSIAFDVSSDGNVIVGRGSSANGFNY